MARASAASKGHNWRLKVFTRALIQMEGLHIPLVRPVLFHLIIIYMNLHRPSCPCSPVFKQIKFYLCNKYKFTLQQFSIHPRPYLEIFNPLLPVRWNFQFTFTRTLKFSIHFYPYVSRYGRGWIEKPLFQSTFTRTFGKLNSHHFFTRPLWLNLDAALSYNLTG